MNNCEPVADDKVLDAVLPARTVLVLGCSLCANFGYCIHRDTSLPVYGTLVQPAAIGREMRRWRSVLDEHAAAMSGKTTLSLCSMLEGSRRRIGRAAASCDAVICLSCAEGARAVEQVVSGKPVVAAMRNRGSVRVNLFRRRGRTYVDPDGVWINGRQFEVAR